MVLTRFVGNLPDWLLEVTVPGGSEFPPDHLVMRRSWSSATKVFEVESWSAREVFDAPYGRERG